ncbi:MAG: polysaccharide ABC transporter ATP-binding protein [Bacteroidetes bacterium]|nr:polysaccharide ABC transporter ATP-binding protein [Bacteroidota bacterium]
MNTTTAIKIENLSKQYRLGLIGTGTLSHDLNRWWTMNVLRREDPFLKIGETNDRSKKGMSDYVWALKDINLEIEQGDVVGIIGKNGAGKSTLLKILSRVTKPSTGIISYKGRIASLLEVGTGFHPEMTGRENIYMNGAIMGMTRAEITRKLDEIVDFAGIERYLDTPTKRYSSGMTVRLGFAIAAHLEPEILVVDEVLAVGDAEFQKKAIGKMQDVSKGEGRTVLFVSHNMAAVRNLCKTGVLLKDGMLNFVGSIDDTIDRYLHFQEERARIDINDIQKRNGNGIIRFTNIQLKDDYGNSRNNFETGENINIIINYNVSEEFSKTKNSRIDIGINTIFGHRIAWLSSKMFTDTILDNGEISFNIERNCLNEGQYNVNLYCDTDFGLADHLVEVSKINIQFNDFYKTGRNIPNNQGYIVLDYKIHN